jgi:hypothetical protein
MGQWRITIEGTGPHHGSDPVQHPDDAEKLAKDFVRELARHGQRIETASFTRIVPDPRVEGLRPDDMMSLNDEGVNARWHRRMSAASPARTEPGTQQET